MKKAIVITITLLMLTSGMFGMINVSTGSENSAGISSAPGNNVPLLTSHAPIRINSNADFTSANGVSSGSGTQADPYIIENYDINGTNYGYCLYIGNTTAYFIVRNCSLHDASGNYGWPYFREFGLHFYNVENGTAENNTASSNNDYGIWLYSSSSNTIANNTASSNNYYGIGLDYSSSNTITNNTASNNGAGIDLFYSSSNTIANNNASNNEYGIYLESSSSNTITDNNANSNNDYGIYLYSSNSNNITNNTMVDDGIFIDGDLLDLDTHNIDTSNTVNGKPVYYWKNQTGGKVPAGAGEVILANCTGVTVENQNVSDGSVGIEIGFSATCTIQNNTASSNSRYGIYLFYSSSNTITNNTANWNNYDGIYLDSSSNNTIANNNASNNDGSGIRLDSSSNNNNTITNNTASNNEYGIYLDSSSNNNNITNNNASNNDDGIRLYSSSSNTITNNIASNNDDGIYLDSSDNNTIANNNASNNWNDGISLYSSSSNTITNNIASNNYDGIWLYSSSSNNNTITNNTASNNEYGIYLDYSSNNTITNNNANSNLNNWEDNGVGIYLDSSDKNTITNNTASNNEYGIYLSSSSNNTITNNTASNNPYYGVYLYYSQNDVFTGNTMINDNIYIYGSSLNRWNTHTIDTTNTVNGKPVYYLKNQTSGTVPAGAGEVILANCTNVIVENQNVSDGSVGILMGFSSDNTIANNTASANSQYGMYLYQSSGNTIINNTASNNHYGMYIHQSSGNTIINNTASNNHYGMYIHQSSGNTIINNTASSNSNDGIYLYSSSNNTIINNTASSNGWYAWYGFYGGIYLDSSSNNTIANNTASNNWRGGIYLGWDSNSNTIANNTASNNGDGIYLGWDSNSNTIANNTASNNGDGIYLDSSSSNTIADNTASNNDYGIYLGWDSNRNTIANNTASNNAYAIYLDYSSTNTITNNTMVDDGIVIGGGSLEHWNTHNIDTSNTVNGKPVYYWKNQTGGTVPAGAGEVILANCSGVSVENQNLNDGSVGIELGFSTACTIQNNTASSNNVYGIYISSSSNNTITNNTASNNEDGIYLDSSSNNTIANNNASNNEDGIGLWSSSNNNTIANNNASNNVMGIYFYSSNTNTIANNTASNNYDGIYFASSSNNTITNNTASSNNNYGIRLYSSNSNTIYHNNFITNANQAYDSTGSNQWNLSYPEGGNYWSDYNGADSFSGPNQDILGSDGIGDTYYTNIQGGHGAQDNYPLMYPTSYTPHFLGNTPWPMFRHDIFHTGISPYNSSAGAWLYWNFTTGGEVSGSAAIADDGTIYTGSSDGKLYAINPDGTEKWNFAADGSINGSSPAIANDGTIYFGTMNGTLHAIYPNGTEKWNYSIGSPILSSPVIGSDGTIYIGANNSKLYAIEQNGTEKWNYTASSSITTSPVIDQDGKIIFSSYNNYTFALNPNGSLNWSVDLHSNISASPVILDLDNDIVVIACMDGNVYGFYTTNGTSAGNLTIGATVSSTPVYAEPYLYVADENGSIHAFNTSNNMSNDWNFTTGGAIYSSPAIDARGNVFFGSADGKIYAISSNGSEVWNYTVGNPVNGSPAINDGMLYIGSSDNNLYAIGDTIPPSVGIDSPSNGTVFNTTTVTVSWHGSDTTSGISHYEIRSNSGNWTDVELNTSYTFTELSDDSYTVEVKVIDNASNENTTSVKFTVDTTAPEITINAPSDGAMLNTSSVTVSWTGSDATSGINHYEVRIDGGSWINVGTAISHDFTGLSDGSHTVDVKAIDNAMNEATDTVGFTVDTTNPTVSITSPADGTIFNTNSVTVSWTGSDATSRISHYEIRINSASWIDVGLNTSHTFTGLSDGSHTVDVKAIDNASNENTASVTFTVDVTAPEVTIDSPSDGAIFNTTTVTVSWSGSDATSGIDHYEIRMDSGSWINVGLNTSYTFTGLSDGSHSVDVKAVDNASNENTDTVTFTVDTTAPEITIDSPSDGTIFNTTTVTVSWNGSDATSGISHYEIRIDSASWIDVGRDTSHTFNGLSDGSHTVYVKALDNAGNENTASVTFTVDAAAPEVTIDSPSDGAIFNTTTVTVLWTGSDATSGIDHYEIRMDSGSWINVGTDTSYTFTGLSDGSHTVDVKAVDNASNENTASVTFTVDTTAPEITINSPSDGAIFNTITVTVSWAGSDATSGIDHYEIRMDSGSWIDVGTDTSYTFTGLSDGSHTVYVKALDNAGNEKTDSVTFTVDATAPEVTINAPSGGAIFNTTTVTVLWTGSDVTTGIDHYEIRMDSGNWTGVELNTSYNFTGLPDGHHTVDVKAVDNASNENTASITFTVDATAPEITITAPSEGSLHTADVQVTWHATDAISVIDHYEIRMDSGNWTDVGTDTKYNFGNMTDGNHTVYVKAIDTAGNTAIAGVNFTVDTTAPTVISHSPIGNNVSVDSAITVTFSEEMDKSTVSIEVNGVTGTIAWNNNTATFTPSQNLSYATNYTVNVTGSDLAGNSMDEYTWSFTTKKASATTETGTITGTVTDTDGNPVAGATVTLDTGETATTDENGYFKIQAHAGDHNLTISKDGYDTETRSTSISPGEVKEVQIPALAPSQENNGLLWLWIVLVLIVLAVIGVAVAKRKKPQEMPAESEETEDSSSSTEDVVPPPEESVEAETPVEEETAEEIGKEEI